jgi:3-keto-5-aminohexanoate cleavage enzyme
MHEPVIVQAALNGGVAGGATGAAPRTGGQLVDDALTAWDAGAAVVHLRADGAAGERGSCAERLAPVVEAIRSAGCDAILGLSCHACGSDRCGSSGYEYLALGPELASLDCGALDAVRDGEAPSARLVAFAAAFREAGTAAELQCADARQVHTALRLREAGLLDAPLRFQLVVGVEHDERAAIERVIRLTSLVPSDAIWSARTSGLRQQRLNVLCMIAGGHVRTGLEDNPWLVQDVPATNQELVERVVRIVDELDRPLATPEEAREILRLGAFRHELPIDLQVASG